MKQINIQTLSIVTNKFSSIEHLVINDQVFLNQIDSLLSYVPQLRRLSLGDLNGVQYSRMHNIVECTRVWLR